MPSPGPGSLQLDATLGGGGHPERIMEGTDPDGRLLGLDADGAAVARVRERLAPRFGDRLVLRQANFRELAEVAPAAGFANADGCFFDLGLSSFQLADTDRGFGFRAGGPLDMRFDTSRGVPAGELLATLSTDELTALFRKYGEQYQIDPLLMAAQGYQESGLNQDAKSAVGAVGISGDTGDQDEACALAGIAAIGLAARPGSADS